MSVASFQSLFFYYLRRNVGAALVGRIRDAGVTHLLGCVELVGCLAACYDGFRMSVFGRRAGSNIRAMAARRQRAAFGRLLLALLLGAGAGWLWLHVAHVTWVRWSVGIGALMVLGLVTEALSTLRRADQALQGAGGESVLEAVLQPLVSAGWELAVNVPLPGYGDIDALLRSPKGKHFVIDAKAHRGVVVARGDELARMMGRRIFGFERDLLGGVLRQCALMAEQYGRAMTPVLCFVQARLLAPLPGAVRGVFVADRGSVVEGLLLLDA